MDYRSPQERVDRAKETLCHRWYTFTQVFSPQLVRYVLSQFDHSTGIILDPFVGTGTTCVECKILGIPSMGIDANPMAVFASRVKTRWNLDTEAVQQEKEGILANVQPHIRELSESTNFSLEDYIGTQRISREIAQIVHSLIFNESITSLVLAKHLVLKEHIDQISEPKIHDFFGLALAATFGSSINIRLESERGLSKSKGDTSVLQHFEDHVNMMISELIQLQRFRAGETRIEQGDARQVLKFVDPETIGGVITSPPYPVDTDYTRQTQLELAILGLVCDINDLQQIERTMIRGSRRHLYKEDREIEHVQDFPEIQALLSELDTWRHQAEDTGGFSTRAPRLVGEYFGGMYAHLAQTYEALKPKGWAAYVLGDKILFGKVHIKTAEILAKLAQRLGYKIKGIEFWRPRISTIRKVSLPENILFLSK